MKLVKTVYNTKELSDSKAINRSFSELKKEPDKLSISKFFEQYRALFFDIPRTGTESHQTLIDNSSEVLGNSFSSKDEEINNLRNKIIELEKQIADLNINNDLNSLNQSINEQINLNNG